MVVCRSGWSGQGGFELFLMDSTKGEQFWGPAVGSRPALRARGGRAE